MILSKTVDRDAAGVQTGETVGPLPAIWHENMMDGGLIGVGVLSRARTWAVLPQTGRPLRLIFGEGIDSSGRPHKIINQAVS